MDSEASTIRQEWVSYRDAQKITGLSRVTLWKMVNNGLIPVSRQGRAVRLHRESLDEVMWRGTRDTGASLASGSDESSSEGQR